MSVRLSCWSFPDYATRCCMSCHDDVDEGYYAFMSSASYPGKMLDVDVDVCCSTGILLDGLVPFVQRKAYAKALWLYRREHRG